jgi:2-keto-4-pentenoate hydratase/2-oxohepta-3-ene-1,7-dioic acid hydratase in catechol pathway
MRIVRYSRQGDVGFGVLEGETVATISPHPFGAFEYTGDRLPAAEIRLLAPVLPSKVLAIGRNYAEHAKELGGEVPKEPLVFLKPPSSLVPPGGVVLLPPESQRVDYEGEMALVIGRTARRISAHAWKEHLLGLTCACDVTCRDLQKTDGQWWRAKGYDTFLPLGPVIDTEADPKDLALETRVDGAVRQSARTSDMFFDVGAILAFVSSAMTLFPGDVILTGTPAGVGPLAPGNRVEVTLEGVGTLAATVAAERVG